MSLNTDINLLARKESALVSAKEAVTKEEQKLAQASEKALRAETAATKTNSNSTRRMKINEARREHDKAVRIQKTSQHYERKKSIYRRKSRNCALPLLEGHNVDKIRQLETQKSKSVRMVEISTVSPVLYKTTRSELSNWRNPWTRFPFSTSASHPKTQIACELKKRPETSAKH